MSGRAVTCDGVFSHVRPCCYMSGRVTCYDMLSRVVAPYHMSQHVIIRHMLYVMACWHVLRRVIACEAVLPRVMACYHMLRSVITCCGLLSHVMACYHVLRRVITCCGLLSRGMACCRVSWRVVVCHGVLSRVVAGEHGCWSCPTW